MEKITRRLFLRNTAAIGAIASTVAAPVIADAATAEPDAMAHWEAFIATLGDRVPAGARLGVFGSADGARVEILVARDERVHPKVVMSVERCVASYRLTPTGWKDESYFGLTT